MTRRMIGCNIAGQRWRIGSEWPWSSGFSITSIATISRSSDFYEDRLKLIEAYDRAGIYGYHCAEHHSTPLGMAPSPSVYLAAIGQRTRRLRFGPLVYTLALYHPLRLAEEICMLDQMSRGRFLLGIGKGISPIEVGYYGVDYKNADKMFAESLAIIMQALTKKTRGFRGRVLPLQERAVRGRAVPEAASAAVVRRGQSRQRRARGESRHELHQQFDRGDGEGQGRALQRRLSSRRPDSRRRSSA